MPLRVTVNSEQPEALEHSDAGERQSHCIARSAEAVGAIATDGARPAGASRTVARSAASSRLWRLAEAPAPGN
jgi:hypothetical protein